MHLLDQPFPCAPAAAGAAILSIGEGRRPGSREAGISGASPADMGPLPPVTDELLSGIRHRSALAGEEIERLVPQANNPAPSGFTHASGSGRRGYREERRRGMVPAEVDATGEGAHRNGT
jgi:hypothetical protein